MGIDHYGFMTYGVTKEYDETFVKLYEESGVEYEELPVVMDVYFAEMHIGLVLFETRNVKDGAEPKKNIVVDPENVTELLDQRDKYKTAFEKSFPDHKHLLEGEWRIRSFILMS